MLLQLRGLRLWLQRHGGLLLSRPTVLFACVQNAGRSQAAAALLERYAGDHVDVLSGGSRPAGEVHPAIARVLTEHGLSPHGAPRAWTDDDVRTADIVVTMGCGDACPYYPGKRYEDWPVDDPGEQPLEVVRGIVAEIEARVRRLAAELLVGR